MLIAARTKLVLPSRQPATAFRASLHGFGGSLQLHFGLSACFKRSHFDLLRFHIGLVPVFYSSFQHLIWVPAGVEGGATALPARVPDGSQLSRRRAGRR